MMCRGHKNAILDLRWTADGDDLVTCSPDATLRLWDAATGQQTKTMKGHKGFVNACDVSRRAGDHAVVSGSDDRTWKLWDMRVSGRVPVMSAHDGFPVTAVAFGADASLRVHGRRRGGCQTLGRARDVRERLGRRRLRKRGSDDDPPRTRGHDHGHAPESRRHASADERR
jgi:Prp8 binding protein